MFGQQLKLIFADSDNTVQCRFDVLCVPGGIYICHCILTYFRPVKQNLRVPGLVDVVTE